MKKREYISEYRYGALLFACIIYGVYFLSKLIALIIYFVNGSQAYLALNPLSLMIFLEEKHSAYEMPLTIITYSIEVLYIAVLIVNYISSRLSLFIVSIAGGLYYIGIVIAFFSPILMGLPYTLIFFLPVATSILVIFAQSQYAQDEEKAEKLNDQKEVK